MLVYVKRKILSVMQIKRLVTRFYKDKNGVMSIEFVLVMPMFVVVLFSVLELSNYIMVDRRAQFAVDYYAEIMSRLPNSRSYSRDMFQGEAVFPLVNTTASPRYKRDPKFWARRSHEMAIASVDMVRSNPSCVGAGCEYEPAVLWRYNRAYYLARQLKTFGCDLAVTSEKGSPDSYILPQTYIGRTPVVMTRIAFEYHPLILKGLISGRFHKKSAIRHVRSEKPIRHYSESYYCPGHSP